MKLQENQIISGVKSTLQKTAVCLAQARARAMIAEGIAPVQPLLARLDKEILGLIPLESKTAVDVLRHTFESGGKRIRPALFFMSAELCHYTGEHLMAMAAVSEFVHTASLLHDDVVDNSTLRRGRPTANSIWGDEASVLVGDLVYARASELMANTGSLEIVASFAQAIRLMSEGELLQLECLYNSELSRDAYFRILECKTATLISVACQSAGLLAQASRAQIDALAQFGRCVGFGFQLVDDALDYLSTAATFGKPTLTDFADGKITLPIILLREQANPAELRELQEAAAALPKDRSDVETVARLVDKYGTAEQTLDLAGVHTQRAIDALRVFVPSKQRDALESFAAKLILRRS